MGECHLLPPCAAAHSPAIPTLPQAEVLLLVREEVLRRLGQQLPPEMQLLEAALGASSSEERLALLKTHALLSTDVIPEPEQQQGQPAGQAAGQGEGGSSSSSSSPALYCLAVDLERAASQVISEMELMPRIPDRRGLVPGVPLAACVGLLRGRSCCRHRGAPDGRLLSPAAASLRSPRRRLLARLVLVREEVRQMLVESFYLQGGAPAGSPEADSLALPFRQLEAVPKADAALLQRLMALPQAPERRALLEWALQDDRERLPEPSRGAAAPPPTSFERARAEAERAQAWVRPGRFMQSLAALQQEMLEPATEAGAAAALGDAALERLESIRRAAVEVLLEMGGEGQPYLP